jgi:protein translocase SecG subunit
MKTAITTIQVITLILIIASVLLQQKGVGLSGVFGGSSSYYKTKLGAEKFVFWITVISSVIFLGVTVWQIIS